MTTLLGTIFIMAMIFATGAIESDNYFIGFIFATLGILSGIVTLYSQNNDDKKSKQLYFKED